MPAKNQQQRAKTKSAPKNETEDSKKDEPSVEQLVQTLNDLFGEIYPELETLNSLLRKEKKGPERDFKRTLLHEDDLRVEYDIRVSTKTGDPIEIEGDLTLHSLLAQALLPEAQQSFAQTVTANVIRPLQLRFQSLVEGRIERKKPVQALPHKKEQDTLLPEPTDEQKPSGADSRPDPTPPPEAGGS